MNDKVVKELTERAIAFLRGEDYNSLKPHSVMEEICTEMNVRFTETMVDGEERKDPRFIAVPTFLSAIVLLDWVLLADERVYQLGKMLANILDYINSEEVINVDHFSTEVMGISQFIITSLSSVGKERMTTVGKAAYTSAVTAITFAAAEIARVYC